MTLEHRVDSWRFAGKFLKRVLGSQIPSQPTHAPIPWTPISKPVRTSRVALLTTAGVSMRGDTPFDMEGERQRPTWGDPSWRRLDADATAQRVEINHLHIDTALIREDLNVALPLDRLRELEASGEVGSVAPSHYSIMGFQGNDTSTLENETAPAIAAAMISEEVDLALLAPV